MRQRQEGGIAAEQFNSQIMYANLFTHMDIALSFLALLEHQQLLLKVSTFSLPFMILLSK